MSMDYAQIVKGCRRRDAKAQRALYDEMAPMAMGVCRRYARGRDEAQDMLQDGFVKVFERIRTLDDSTRLREWVYQLMVNTCIDHYRVNRRWLLLDESDIDAPHIDTDPFSGEEVIRAMQQLPPQQRAVFNLCDVEGYTLDEAAERLHSNNLSVRVTLSRARQTLRGILECKQ